MPAVEPLRLAREQTILTAEPSPETGEIAMPDAFRSWGEVFDLSRLGTGLGGPEPLAISTTGITCWGNGQLNIRRADDASIVAATQA